MGNDEDWNVVYSYSRAQAIADRLALLVAGTGPQLDAGNPGPGRP